MAVRIAFLCDDRLFADGLVRIVKADDGFVVAAAGESRDGLPAALSQHPHILIIDSALPDAVALCVERRAIDRRQLRGGSLAQCGTRRACAGRCGRENRSR